MTRLLALMAALFAAPLFAAENDWIAESNQHAQILLDVMARYGPEYAASLGVEGYDAEVFDLKPRVAERRESDLAAAAKRLEAARAQASDPRVRQDLDILLDAARDRRASSMLNRAHLLPFFDLPQAIFSGFQNLIDERVPKERQRAALTRLKRYIGAERGYEPITQLARARYEEAAVDPKLLGPWITRSAISTASRRCCRAAASRGGGEICKRCAVR
jgi:hypothetical protein